MTEPIILTSGQDVPVDIATWTEMTSADHSLTLPLFGIVHLAALKSPVTSELLIYAYHLDNDGRVNSGRIYGPGDENIPVLLANIGNELYYHLPILKRPTNKFLINECVDECQTETGG